MSVVVPDRWVVDVALSPPSLSDAGADVDRLHAALCARLDADEVEID
jgi:hypothetical protein